VNADGKSARDFAMEKGRKEIVKFLDSWAPVGSMKEGLACPVL
jgi:hypothetical protein